LPQNDGFGENASLCETKIDIPRYGRGVVFAPLSKFFTCLALLWPNPYLPPMTDPIRHSQLSVVIPVYRSEAALPTPVQRLQPVLAAQRGWVR